MKNIYTAILALITFCASAQITTNHGDLFFEKTNYSIANTAGQKIETRSAGQLDCKDYPDGLYVIWMNGTPRANFVVANGEVVGINPYHQLKSTITDTVFISTADTVQVSLGDTVVLTSTDTVTITVTDTVTIRDTLPSDTIIIVDTLPGDTVIIQFEKCAEGMFTGRPFHDSASFMYFIHSETDSLLTVEDKLATLTHILARWYPLSQFGVWAPQTYLWPVGRMINHFLQIDTMGMCGDQSTFLGTLAYHLWGVKSCAISIRENGNDSTAEGHVQVLFEVPYASGDTVWGIFDAQNDIIYRDSTGDLADFRGMYLRFVKPFADETRSRGHYYSTWSCFRRDNHWPFPFETMEGLVYHDDTTVFIGERSLSFTFTWQISAFTDVYRHIGQSYGYPTANLSPLELTSVLPLFTRGIYETTCYTPGIGIWENIDFAARVRNTLSLQHLKYSTSNTYHPVNSAGFRQ